MERQKVRGIRRISEVILKKLRKKGIRISWFLVPLLAILYLETERLGRGLTYDEIQSIWKNPDLEYHSLTMMVNARLLEKTRGYQKYIDPRTGISTEPELVCLFAVSEKMKDFSVFWKRFEV
jgi:hypothetical protein